MQKSTLLKLPHPVMLKTKSELTRSAAVHGRLKCKQSLQFFNSIHFCELTQGYIVPVKVP